MADLLNLEWLEVIECSAAELVVATSGADCTTSQAPVIRIRASGIALCDSVPRGWESVSVAAESNLPVVASSMHVRDIEAGRTDDDNRVNGP
jgi:hypothetical protein